MRIVKAILIALLILVFLAGLAVLLYPTLYGMLTDLRVEDVAVSFLERHETDPTEPTEPTGTEPEETTPRAYAELWNDMVSYNEQIWLEKQVGLCDPWSYEQPSFSLEAYGVEEVFGVISIPKLDLSMPIYLGATYQHLADGAAHLSQTSLPIGGNNTNCVIAGHRGWKGASYFRYITDLKVGDEVIITNLWETLRHQVCEIKIIDPHEVQEILIQEDRELLTLLTFHPYASGGRQRYVVFCERVKEQLP